ncbi:MAG: TlyA family RNA methyltransferase [Amphiplicatus sp.]
MSRSRLDRWLVESGAFPTRARAQAAVKAGLVRVEGVVADKSSALVADGAEVSIAGAAHPYVSRGGVKLAAALDAFVLEPAGAICLDLGASTGGFTDVLLRAGAAKVYAVDVGTGQLHPSLAADRRVVNLERTHAKDLGPALIPETIGLLVCDVSFIGLRKALPPAMALCGAGARLVALVKPQFELGPGRVGKGGLVAAPASEIAALLGGIRAFFEAEGWRVAGLIDSPIAGGDGNREHLLGAIKTGRS